MVPVRLHKEQGLAEKIPTEPAFKEAEALAQGRTIVATPRLMNLYLLMRFFLTAHWSRPHHRVRKLSRRVRVVHGEAGATPPARRASLRT